MPRQPTLVVFDVDGTLADVSGADVSGDIYDNDRLMKLTAIQNMVTIAKQYVGTKNVELMFCTGRPKRSSNVTWRWLNSKLSLAQSGQRVTLACRPDDVPDDRISTYKLGEVVRAIRRIGSKPPEAIIFDDDIANLQMFETVRPMVGRLKLFKVENGVASKWGD